MSILSFRAKIRANGFTLLEVMVAMAILAIGTAGVMQIFSTSLKGIGKSDLYTEGTIIARSLIEAEMLKTELEEGQTTGIVRDLFEYNIDVYDLPIVTSSASGIPQDETANSLAIDWLPEDSPVHLFEIVVHVSWPQAAFPGEVKLQTYSTRLIQDQTKTEQ